MWVALLRGINVGSAKRISMADLRAAIESIGGEDVRTILQSGNAVFSAPATNAGRVAAAVEEAVLSRCGVQSKTLVRSAKDFAAVMDANPFCGAAGRDVSKLAVTFLAAKPTAKQITGIDPSVLAPDEFAFGDCVIYTVQPNGVMGTRLPDWGKVLGMTVTARNWNTVCKIGAA